MNLIILSLYRLPSYLPLVIRTRLAIVPFCLTVRIAAVPLTAGVADEVFAAGHACQDRALRKHIIRIGIGRRRDVRYHTRKGIPRNIENGMHFGSHFDLMRFPVLFQPYTDIGEHLGQIKYAAVVVLGDALHIFVIARNLPVFF